MECSGPPHDVVGRFAFALQQQVGLADGVGLGVDLLAVEVRGDLLAVLAGELSQGLLSHRQDAAGAAGAVVQQVGARTDPVGDGQEDELRHQPHSVTGRPVLSRLLVVLLVEAAHQLLEDRSHSVVVEAGVLDGAVGVTHRGRTQVDVRRGELLDQGAQGVRLGEPGDLVAKLEVVEDVLHVRREPVQPGPEVGLQLLAVGASAQVVQGELRGVVELLSRCLPQGRVLLDQAGVVEGGLHVQNRLLALLQYGVEPPQHGHGQDHVPVLSHARTGLAGHRPRGPRCSSRSNSGLGCSNCAPLPRRHLATTLRPTLQVHQVLRCLAY